jgi:hypothetical protein
LRTLVPLHIDVRARASHIWWRDIILVVCIMGDWASRASGTGRAIVAECGEFGDIWMICVEPEVC